MTMKHNPNLKKIFVIFLFLLINLSLVYATLSDPRLISGSDYSIILNKEYSDEIIRYYDLEPNVNGGIGIYSSDISELCQSGYTAGPFPPAGCTNPYYLCAAIKVGSSYKAISDCLTVSPTGGWASGAKSAYADVDFNNINYPARIHVVLSKDDSVSDDDNFFQVEYLNGWFKGLNPHKDNSAFDLDYSLNEGRIDLVILSAYSSDYKSIQYDRSNELMVGISKLENPLLDEDYISSGIVLLGEHITFSFDQDGKEIYIFVNGILESSFNSSLQNFFSSSKEGTQSNERRSPTQEDNISPKDSLEILEDTINNSNIELIPSSDTEPLTNLPTLERKPTPLFENNHKYIVFGVLAISLLGALSFLFIRMKFTFFGNLPYLTKKRIKKKRKK